MKTFEKFIREMALERGVHHQNAYSRKFEWDRDKEEYKNKGLLFLERKDIGSQHLRLYRLGTSQFFLTDEQDEYKGHIEATLNNGIAKIGNSNSNIRRGFYNIIFTTMLSLDDISEIRSDHLLSTNAINSYEKLLVNSSLALQVYNPINFKYYPFSREELLKLPKNVVSIKEKHSLSEHFGEYYSRIYSSETINGVEIPTGYSTEFKNYGSGIDNFLFCEYYN
jgi:hypothetical protein